MKTLIKSKFMKFAIIGVIGTGIHMVVLYSLTDLFQVYYMFSAVFAFITANIFTFSMNKIWTFAEKFKEKTFVKYLKFLFISLITLGVNLSLLYFFTEYLHIYYLVSQILAIALSLWINFFGNKKFTFEKVV